MGTILSFIDESIHDIQWLRATWLGAAWWCCRTCNTVRVSHKGIPVCQQWQRMLHSKVPYLPPIAATCHLHTKQIETIQQRPPCLITWLAILRCHYQLCLEPDHTTPVISLTWCGQFVCTIVLPVIIDIICNIHHHLRTKDVDVRKSMHGTPHMYCTKCEPLRKVMKSWLPACESGVPSGATVLTTLAWCRSVPFPEGAVEVSGVPGPQKKGSVPFVNGR